MVEAVVVVAVVQSVTSACISRTRRFPRGCPLSPSSSAVRCGRCLVPGWVARSWVKGYWSEKRKNLHRFGAIDLSARNYVSLRVTVGPTTPPTLVPTPKETTTSWYGTEVWVWVWVWVLVPPALRSSSPSSRSRARSPNWRRSDANSGVVGMESRKADRTVCAAGRSSAVVTAR